METAFFELKSTQQSNGHWWRWNKSGFRSYFKVILITNCLIETQWTTSRKKYTHSGLLSLKNYFRHKMRTPEPLPWNWTGILLYQEFIYKLYICCTGILLTILHIYLSLLTYYLTLNDRDIMNIQSLFWVT